MTTTVVITASTTPSYRTTPADFGNSEGTHSDGMSSTSLQFPLYLSRPTISADSRNGRGSGNDSCGG